MKASKLVSKIRAARKANRPVMVWGPPGIGKTALIELCAKLDQCEMLTWMLPLMDAVDTRGIPSTANGVTTWNPPAELPRKGSGYLFCDELPQAPQSVTNAVTGLIFGGRIGEYKLPKGWYMLAAGNGDGDMASTHKMATHVASRFIHLTLEVDVEEWLQWAERSNLDGRVVAFIKYRPKWLHQFEPRSAEKAFPCPRTWDFASQVMQQMPECTWGETDDLELLTGIVGKNAATEFVGFLRIFEKLVSIDSIISDPKKAKLTDDISVNYALVYALAERATRATLGALTQYIDRMSKDFGFLFFRRIDQQHPELKKSAEFIKWCSANQHLA